MLLWSLLTASYAPPPPQQQQWNAGPPTGQPPPPHYAQTGAGYQPPNEYQHRMQAPYGNAPSGS